jgi:lysophospholipase L1-like esterase
MVFAGPKEGFVLHFEAVLKGILSSGGRMCAVWIFAVIFWAASSQVKGSGWTGTWAASAQAIDATTMPPTPPGLADTTLRQVVRVSIGGTRLRVRFSDAFEGSIGEGLKIDEAEVAVAAGGRAIKAGTARALTFHGEGSVTIPPGALMISDPVDFELAPGSDLAVTIHVNETGKEITGHRNARGEGAFLQAGNAVGAADLPAAVAAKVWYYLCGVDVATPGAGAAVVCLGDSITDGHGSTEGANRRWPDLFARRLQANTRTAHIGVLNEGIGGNCVWQGGLGQPAIVRMQRDVLAQANARWLIVFEGINDLGGGKTTAEQVITGLEQIVRQAKDRKMIVYGVTITPCEGFGMYYTPEMEEKREKVNDWIRKSGAYDAVIDADAAVRDPQDPKRLLKAADSGDHLHPGDKGYEMIVGGMDLKLFEN